MTKTKRNELLLLLTAFIWGFAFVAQTTGGDLIGAFSFNCIRSIIGGIVLIPVVLFLDRRGASRKPVTGAEKKLLWKAGILCGLALCVASNLQQQAITLGASTGKAGFLTTTYILLVPILGIFLRRKCGLNVWAGVGLALVGMYLLCFEGKLALSLADGLLLLCALIFSVQILLVDHYAPLVDGVRLSQIQFIVSGLGSGLGMVIKDICIDNGSLARWAGHFANAGAWTSLLFAGVLSCGVAYTLQIIGQEGVNPTVASLLMSFESVFSVIGGWLILGQKLSLRQLLGCGLIFAAVLLAQLKENEVN